MGSLTAYFAPRSPVPPERVEAVREALLRVLDEHAMTFAGADFQEYPVPLWVPPNPYEVTCPECAEGLYERIVGLIDQVDFDDHTVDRALVICDHCGWCGSLRDLDTETSELAVTSQCFHVDDIEGSAISDELHKDVEKLLGSVKLLVAWDT